MDWRKVTDWPIIRDGSSRTTSLSESAPRIPSSWIEGVARLSHRRPPPDIPPHRWRQFVADCTSSNVYLHKAK